MPFTDRLRQQHDLAATTAHELRRLVGRHRPGDDAIAVATQLARLLGVLRVHLAEEDRTLYQALAATNDGVAAALARRCQAEMGELAWDLELFMQRWSSSAMIALHFATFETALDELLASLVTRMEREDTMLYPVADALFPDLRDKAASAYASITTDN